MSSFDLPHSALLLIHALADKPHGATYEGLRVLLGFSSIHSVRAAVRRAAKLHCVHVASPGVGRSARSVVYLTDQSRRLLSELKSETP